MAKRKWPTRMRAPMDERIRRLAALGYLAAMLWDQGDKRSMRQVLREIQECTEADKNMVRVLYPEFLLACQAFELQLMTHDPQSMGIH